MLRASFPPEIAEVLKASATKWPARACLQRARVDLDMAWMLALRNTFEALAVEGAPVDCHLFFEGSPASGFETFAVIEQRVDAEVGQFAERTLPMMFF